MLCNAYSQKCHKWNQDTNIKFTGIFSLTPLNFSFPIKCLKSRNLSVFSLQQCYCSYNQHSLKMYTLDIIRALISFLCVYIHLPTKESSLSRFILLPNKAKLTDNQLKLGQWTDTFPPVWLPFRLLILIRVCLLLQHKTELCQDQSKSRSIV